MRRFVLSKTARIIKLTSLVLLLTISQLWASDIYSKTSTISLDLEIAQQQIQISGKVSDENGDPLPGVNILLIGTTVGTITDVNGNFTLSVPKEGTLLFTYVGYEPQEIDINGRFEFNIVLRRSISDIDEVIVMGYNTKARKEISSAVAELNSSELMDITSADIGSMLQGKVAGVQVVNSSGAPGRGVPSLSDTVPLMVFCWAT